MVRKSSKSGRPLNGNSIFQGRDSVSLLLHQALEYFYTRNYRKNTMPPYLGKDLCDRTECESCCPRTTYHQKLGLDCHSFVHDIVFYHRKNENSQKKLSSCPNYHLCSLQQRHVTKDLIDHLFETISSVNSRLK